MRYLLASILLLLAPAAPAQVAESAYNVVLTATRTVPGPAGDRMQRMRIGTKDVIDRFRDALGGISGRRMQLIVQRPLDDLGLQRACEYLVIDGEYHEVGGTSAAIEMPGSFYGMAGSSARRPGQPDFFFSQEAAGMFRMDGFPQGGEFTFSAVARRWARLLTTRQGTHLGYLHTRLMWNVSGGIEDPLGRMPVSGTLMLGPERLVESGAQPCGS